MVRVFILERCDEMKFLKNEKGQSLVEFALVIPLLLIILMAIFEFALMFNSYLVISNASREGARLASLGGSDFAVEERVKSVSGSLDLLNIIVTVTPDETSRSRGDMVQVLVEYDYTLVSPIISNILSNFIDIESETFMRVE